MDLATNHNNQNEQALLAKKAQQGDGRALETLIKANMGFVINLAKEYQQGGMELDDLVSEGSIALMNAILKWNPEKTPSLVAYAVYDIRKAMEKTVAQENMIVRIPEGEFANVKSMDAPVRPGHSRSLGETMPEKSGKAPDAATDDLFITEEMLERVKMLPSREQEIILCFYGIGRPHMTMSEIGDAMGLRRERVRQIRKKAERQLRKINK